MMRTVQYKYKRIICCVLGIFVLYLLVRIGEYQHEESIKLKNVKAVDAWDFVADFSNMKYLNPTIIEFNILSESGNYAHWVYTTAYTEVLSHWPYLSNVNVAKFDVYSSKNMKDTYYINSTHRTCLFRGFICLDSKSTFTFSPAENNATQCVESIQFECPVLLSNFCTREVKYQRTAIMNNLRKHFH